MSGETLTSKQKVDPLTERLRFLRPTAKFKFAKDQFYMVGQVMHEAAAEIERLQAGVGMLENVNAQLGERLRAASEPGAVHTIPGITTEDDLKKLAWTFDSTGCAGVIHHFRFRERDLLALLRNVIERAQRFERTAEPPGVTLAPQERHALFIGAQEARDPTACKLLLQLYDRTAVTKADAPYVMKPSEEAVFAKVHKAHAIDTGRLAGETGDGR